MEFPTLIIEPVHFRFKGCLVAFFIFIQILMQYLYNKQWWRWSYTMFCRVWSWSALFAYAPQNVHQALKL